MGGKTHVTNIQTGTKENKDNYLVYDHNKARVLATVIPTFNEHMDCKGEEHGQQHVVAYSLNAGVNKFSN